jgi:hypothetical protein
MRFESPKTKPISGRLKFVAFYFLGRPTECPKAIHIDIGERFAGTSGNLHNILAGIVRRFPGVAGFGWPARLCIASAL